MNGNYHTKKLAARNSHNEGSHSSHLLLLLVVNLLIYLALRRLTFFHVCVQESVFHPSGATNANNLKICHWRLYLSPRSCNCFLGITNELKVSNLHSSCQILQPTNIHENQPLSFPCIQRTLFSLIKLWTNKRHFNCLFTSQTHVALLEENKLHLEKLD